MKIEFLGTRLQSPLIIGSGPLSYGAEGMIALNEAGAGAVVTKTIRDEGAVNPEPHIASIGNQSLINSEKWSDFPGERWVSEELPRALAAGVKVIASLGQSEPEVARWLPRVNGLDVLAFELVSYDEPDIVPMVKTAVSLTDKPVLAKISPNWPDPVKAALACLEAGAAGITATDSLGPVLSIDIKTARPRLAGEGGSGWMTGGAIKPLTLRYVADIASRTDKPVIALGGVMGAEDALEMILAGASAVGVCSLPMLKGLGILEKTTARLEALIRDLDYGSFEAARGRALTFLPDREILEPNRLAMKDPCCRLCGLCVTRCSYGALSIGGGELRVEKENCRRCGLCVSSCPVDNLSLERGAL